MQTLIVNGKTIANDVGVIRINQDDTATVCVKLTDEDAVGGDKWRTTCGNGCSSITQEREVPNQPDSPVVLAFIFEKINDGVDVHIHKTHGNRAHQIKAVWKFRIEPETEKESRADPQQETVEKTPEQDVRTAERTVPATPAHNKGNNESNKDGISQFMVASVWFGCVTVGSILILTILLIVVPLNCIGKKAVQIDKYSITPSPTATQAADDN